MQTSGGEQASDLPGYYKNSVPACKESKSGGVIPPVPFFFLKIALAIRGFLYFHTNCEIIRSSSVKKYCW